MGGICIINKVPRLFAAVSSAHLEAKLCVLLWVHDLDKVSWPVDWSGPLTVASREQRVSELHSDTIKNKRKTKEKRGRPSFFPPVRISGLFLENMPNKFNVINFWVVRSNCRINVCDSLAFLKRKHLPKVRVEKSWLSKKRSFCNPQLTLI